MKKLSMFIATTLFIVSFGIMNIFYVPFIETIKFGDIIISQQPFFSSIFFISPTNPTIADYFSVLSIDYSRYFIQLLIILLFSLALFSIIYNGGEDKKKEE